jgi:hypothetical protein
LNKDTTTHEFGTIGISKSTSRNDVFAGFSITEKSKFTRTGSVKMTGGAEESRYFFTAGNLDLLLRERGAE